MTNEDEDDFGIDHKAICIVAGAHCASNAEVKRAIKGIEKTIGTGYYDDPDGDILLQHIVDYLKKKID